MREGLEGVAHNSLVRMDEHNYIHIPMLCKSIVLMCLLLLTSLPLSHCDPDCKDLPYNCGALSNIYGPFWGENRPPHCGRGDSFKLICYHDHYFGITTTIQIGSQNFTVKEIHTDYNTMVLVRADLARNYCSPGIDDSYNVNSSTLLQYAPSVYNITIFYNCSSSSYIDNLPGHFMCRKDHAIYYYDLSADELLKIFPWLFMECKRHVQVPADVRRPTDTDVHDFLQEVLRQGFKVNYNLHHKSRKVILPKVIVGVAIALTGGFIICIIICFCKYKSSTQVEFSLKIRNDHNIEAFLKNHGALAQRRYKFSEVKKMTKSFKVKLGQGGFGAVYKGELLNGSTVAVKMLNASKANGEDFINEVASISRTSHVNIVTLLGFCLEGHKKALIYEFMPNGSLDKFLSNKGIKKNSESLSWDNLWQISLGIARGLEYLHRGCNTRILHFDIKPHNILLGEDFCPKISDFGLAKLCPRKESIISMSVARGTIGYVAPEMWNINFGGISHKSDVYSYGMMLLEMVGVRENINADSSHTSETYFPDWIYKMLEQGEGLRTDGEIGTEEKEIARRMTVVGLWCVQTFPKDRPAMSRVIDMLEGNMNSLEMPPKPVLSSPPRSLPQLSTTSLSSG